RNDRRPWARPPLRSVRRRRVSGHGDHYSRPGPRSDQGRAIARRGKGRPTGEGVHGTLRQPRRRLDNGSLHRGYLPESRQGEVLRTAERKRDSAQHQLWPAAATAVLLLLLAGPTTGRAQQRGGIAATSARDAAPIDLTGYW